LYRGLIVFTSTKQKTVALSTLEVEYIALAEAVKEALWLLRWLQEVGFDIPSILINMDNMGAIQFAENAQFSQRTKHIDIRHHFIRDYIERGIIKLSHVALEDNIADILTKGLDRIKYVKLREGLGVTGMDHVSTGSK
jgi:hypothetical protein